MEAMNIKETVIRESDIYNGGLNEQDAIQN